MNLFAAVILLVFSAQAKDLGFRFIDGKCVDSKGVEGLNPYFFGQCSDLRNVVLGRFDLSGIDFSGSLFGNSDLQQTILNATTLTKVSFEGANLSGASFAEAKINNTTFTQAVLRNTQFADAQILNSDFSTTDLSGAILSYVRFQNCKMIGGNFSGATMDGSDLTSSILTSAVFSKAILKNAILSGVEISGADFSQADLTRASLRGSMGSKPRFGSSFLNSADLTGINWADAVLKSAKLNGAILSSAKLEGADLSSAVLTSAKVDGAVFKNALFNKFTQLPFNRSTADRLGMIFKDSGSVLILWDAKTTYLDSLVEFLKSQGAEVTLTEGPENTFDGTLSLAEYNSIIHLNGVTYSDDMPVAGQMALVNFVEKGGTFIYGEWNAFEMGQGQMTKMRDLTVIDRENGDQKAITVTALVENPLLENVEKTFSIDCGINVGKAHDFGDGSTMVLMRDSENNDMVVSRNFKAGKIIGLGFAGNYGDSACLSNPNLQRIYLNAINL